MHAFSSVETSPDWSKSQSFVDFVQIYTLFLSHRDISSFKSSFHCITRADCSARALQRRHKPRHTQIAIIRRVCPKLCVISLPCKIFRRLSAVFTVLCVQNVVHAFSSVETSPHTRKSQSFVDSDNNYSLFLSRLIYFDVSTNLSLHADRRARFLQCRNKPRQTQIAIIRRFWR